ncbi:hypothetical protein [Stenotrophomonas mori]|uniref:Uncharacterized protein n=1 Tax=Stenotrophomonas mori TaxID=2871096 RepID=A0ABT0SDI3_9GAMM|nr:hypothetical protein [Stenotrophomonas mori]MCL7713371.1 hypothetical protein [Stenotrophomonas mori]
MPASPLPRLPLLFAAALLSGCGGARGTPARSSPALEIGRPSAPVTAMVRLPRQLPPGAPLTGQVPPGSSVTANGEALPVSADGRVDWPVPAGTTAVRLRVERPDGRVIVQQLEVKVQAQTEEHRTPEAPVRPPPAAE